MKNSAFTLIELLVVIGIIGILAAIILTNLESSGSKAIDASAKTTLSSARSTAQLYLSDHDTYAGLCSPNLAPYYASRSTYYVGTVLPPDATEFDKLMYGIAQKAGYIPYITTWNNAAYCQIFPPDEYIAFFPILATSNGYTPTEYFCIDSTGFAGNVPVNNTCGFLCDVHECPR